MPARREVNPLKKEVTVTVDTKADAYWVAIDKSDLKFTGNKAVIQLAPNDASVPDYSLLWWVIGAPGTKYTITVKIPGVKDDLKIDKSIAAGSTKAAGARKFKV
jgi:hypothetical protein